MNWAPMEWKAEGRRKETAATCSARWRCLIICGSPKGRPTNRPQGFFRSAGLCIVACVWCIVHCGLCIVHCGRLVRSMHALVAPLGCWRACNKYDLFKLLSSEPLEQLWRPLFLLASLFAGGAVWAQWAKLAAR